MMPRGAEYRLEKSRLYHFPHNSALYEEFEFMLKSLDPEKTSKKVYTFGEISKILLVEQVKEGTFEQFHPKPYDIFTKKPPPDFDTLVDKMGGKNAKKLSEDRRSAFKRFLEDPNCNYEGFVDVQYKPTKTWRQNWVEFVRDYADLAAYCGLLPAFFKNPLGNSDRSIDLIFSVTLPFYLIAAHFRLIHYLKCQSAREPNRSFPRLRSSILQ